MTDNSESVSNFVQDLRVAATRNPVSAALIGMGALWILTGAKTPSAARETFRNVGFEYIPDALGQVRSGFKDTGESIRSAAASTAEALRSHATGAFDNVDEYRRAMPDPGAVYASARDGLTTLFKAQPLALGAIGLSIGAGIAAALPKTDVEEAYLGDISQAVKTQASDIASEQLEKASTLVSSVMAVASEEARHQNLTPNGAKAAIEDVTERLGRVVDVAKQGLKESTNFNKGE